ncbi:MAG: chemotaxis protein CheW [Bacillota bacterium]
MAQRLEVNGKEGQVVVFKLAGETYGVDIASVAEIIRMESITRVPRTPEFIEGVINLRGKVIPVIDLRRRFDLPKGEQSRQTRIIIVEMGEMVIGMIVDAVIEVLRVSEESIEPPPAVINGVDVIYLRGIALREERMIILLNLEKILYAHEKEALQQTELIEVSPGEMQSV